MSGQLSNTRGTASPAADHSDYLMLISLALDEMLEPEEKQRLDRHLDRCDTCRSQWILWQVIDQRLRVAPMPAPSPEFVYQVAERVRQQERQRTLRVGLLLAVLTVFVWSIGLAGMGLVAASLVYTNLAWFTEMRQFLTSTWTMGSVVGHSLWGVLIGLPTTPKLLGAATTCAYFLVSVLALASWSIFLRHSMQPVEPRTVRSIP